MATTLPILTVAQRTVRRCEHCSRSVLLFRSDGISVRARHGSEVHETHISLPELISFLALQGLAVVNVNRTEAVASR